MLLARVQVLHMALAALLLLLAASAVAAPQVSGVPTVFGFASSMLWDRDSCMSAFVLGRQLWTCRDSLGKYTFLSSSSSWADFNSDGSPIIQNFAWNLYGNQSTTDAYFTPPDGYGGTRAGERQDFTRYAFWPSSRPLVVSDGGAVKMYTWIAKTHVTLLLYNLQLNPGGALYRADYAPQGDDYETLPEVSIVDQDFWAEEAILYGEYGHIVVNDTAYLYGRLNGTAGTALAKVPVSQIEDRSAYRYYYAEGWSDTPPSIFDLDGAAAIPHAGTGGQGTFFWSDHFQAYTWIGGNVYASGDPGFYISTAPAPEGPWTEPSQFYQGEKGTARWGAYTMQAHPDMSPKGETILSYTKADLVLGAAHYTHPLIRVKWA
ncbi:hypothetical protein K470DRAFT_82776 [Piedraia hortae CBS 480.64]|uniref:DUF4185 domain-containing protein n=1 Tax=Piedraia hortae CBS 480.64 TaxID=1314780 RepID=A0A6A7C9X5_9PEZI|nr:hypothetical protein K470DRAFT_82776 [Piedraia hortae CBS 480.64]